MTTKRGYVGKSRNRLAKRISDHLCDSSGCIAIRDALKCHGRDNFVLELLAKDIPLHSIDAAEVKYIAEHGTYEHGYNLTKGGEINPMDDPETRAKHKSIMGSREFIEKAAIKRNKTFKTKAYKDRTSAVHIASWDTVVDRTKHSASQKRAWTKNREQRVESLKRSWQDDERRRRQLDGMAQFFAMKKDPNVSQEELKAWQKQRARENGARARDKKKAQLAPEGLAKTTGGTAQQTKWVSSGDDCIGGVENVLT